MGINCYFSMTCFTPKPIFPSPYWKGLQDALPQKDGYTVHLSWKYATASVPSYLVGYNVYFSTNVDDVFSEGPKYFTEELSLDIKRFNPGDTWYFAVRAMEYDPTLLHYTSFPPSPQALNAYIYPSSMLASDIDGYQLDIPLIDVSEFPSEGIIKVGAELIQYSLIDYGGNIIYTDGYGRGYYNTSARSHTIDGYDGISYKDPIVVYFTGWEDQNTIIVEAEPRIEPNEFIYVESDGYKQVTKDILTTDLGGSDTSNANFPTYDYSGYHQTNILDYFSGHCIGSYSGGQYGCADGYMLRGLNLQDINTQRLDMLLDAEGEPVVLLRRLWTGLRCKCFRMNQEQPEGRCDKCFATGFVGGYEQYFNPRRPDGRIMVRFDPTVDSLTLKPMGLQETFIPNCWTLVIPAIKHRDVLIRFNEDGTEEFRYEVVNVTRNKLLFSLSGSQKMQAYRLDHTDPVYQWRATRSTADLPVQYNTTLGTLRGYGPHLHTITISNNIVNLSQINTTTSINAAHSHPVINGIILEVLGHSHSIIF